MKFAAFCLLAPGAVGFSATLDDSPLNKALQLVNALAAKINDNGQAADKTRSEFDGWCAVISKSVQADLRAASSKKQQLEAVIGKAASEEQDISADIEASASAGNTPGSERAHNTDVGERAEILEKAARAKGELESTTRDLSNAQNFLDASQGFCRAASEDHEATVRSRSATLNAIAGAKDAISSMAGGQFLMMSKRASQRSHAESRWDPRNHKVSDLVSRLAFKQQSSMLSQLASSMEAVVRLGDLTGQDEFAKIKGMLVDMIMRLESDSNSEISEKAFCDEQLAQSKENENGLESDATERSAKVDETSAHAAKLAEEVVDAQKELAALAKSQAQLLAIRQQGKDANTATKKTCESGLQSVQNAIVAVRDYTNGGGQSVRTLLEAVVGTLATQLTSVNMEEDGLASGFDKMVQISAMTKALKEKDVEHNTREQTSTARELSEASNDHGATNEELGAVKDYQAKLQQRCVAKPESYSERKQRREEEIAGLKEALDMLQRDYGLVQTRRRGGQRSLRVRSM